MSKKNKDESTSEAPRPLVKKAECAALLGIKIRTLDKYVALGKIPVIRLSQKCVRFDLDDVVQTLK